MRCIGILHHILKYVAVLRSPLILIPVLCFAADPVVHRLNRTEYEYSVRDLLGVPQAAKDFPPDDSGHGFDNNRDVLSVAPLLMERYLSAAEKTARTAVFGPPAMQPAVVQYLAPLRGSPKVEAPAPGASYDATGLSMTGSQHTRHTFPIDGEYRFALMLDGAQPAGPEPLRAGVWIDGVLLGTAETATGIQNGKVMDIRGKITAGEHTVSASFLKLFAGLAPPAVSTARMASIEIAGPFGATGGPVPPPVDLASLARHAFRRRVAAAEMAQLTGIADGVRKQGGSDREAQTAAIEAILVSPKFLFRADDDRASRLSYFLWSSVPDDELLAADLRNPAELEAQVRRLLRDPKIARFVENFGGQWLEIRRLESVQPDVHYFPDFDDYLRFSMRRETEQFFRAVIADDRSILDFLDARYSFVNQRLAGLYGIGGVEGARFRRVDLAGTPRAGVLTQASVLTVSSFATRTSPVLRGKWILENLLNAAPPPPPAGVPGIDEAGGAAIPMRRRMEQHRQNPACSGCHATMDPLGFALENFDGIGHWRPADASGKLPDGRTVDGPAELAAVLRARPDEFARCFVEKLLTYALGRGLEPADEALVNRIVKRTAARHYRFSDIVVEIAKGLP